MAIGGVDIAGEDARARALAEGQRRILALINDDRPLGEVLETICHVIEAQAEGMIASVLLVDAAGEHLLLGAAPSLPPAYNAAIDGLTIGDGVGSCGTAAATGVPCFVDDIAQHPNWVPFRHLAARHTLGACWSTPVRASDGRVIATFGMYYPTPRSASLTERKLIDYTAHLVAIAVNRSQDRDLLREAP